MEVNPRPRRTPERAGVEPLGRRAVDLVLAGALLLLSMPLVALGAVAVLVGSGRPVLFGHQRLGRGGRLFRCWKLRTMRVGAEEVLDEEPGLRRRHRTNGFKLPVDEDPRVTPEGRWLRRTHLDELPQLLNVLRGEMSLVGPRPIVPEELELFQPGGEELLSVRPGIFGAWTALGRRRPPYPERARVELDYVRTRSWSRDARILGRNLVAVLRGAGDP